MLSHCHKILLQMLVVLLSFAKICDDFSRHHQLLLLLRVKIIAIDRPRTTAIYGKIPALPHPLLVVLIECTLCAVRFRGNICCLSVLRGWYLDLLAHKDLVLGERIEEQLLLGGVFAAPILRQFVESCFLPLIALAVVLLLFAKFKCARSCR